ncbi:MAG: thioesterase family protein [Nocardioidaceae bacterium]
METGQQASLERTVTEEDTAVALGSGDLPVLATPRLLAWCEGATCAAVADSLEASRTSVGTRVQLEHVAPSPLGARVTVTATLAYVDPPRLLRFEVVATHDDGKVVGHGEVTRVVVDRERFLSRLG